MGLRRPLGLFVCSAGVAAHGRWPEAPGRPPAAELEELALGEGVAARCAAAFEAEAAAAAARRAAARGLSALVKLPARVRPERTQHGEGYFAIIGDWGNPFRPGTNESAKAFWGPHWKCNTQQGDPVRCRRGSPEWERDEFAQVNVARALASYSRRNEVQFIINVGDNLYPSGFESPHDPRWQYVFEDRYADESLQVPWLSVLGNHDWGGFDCYLRSGRLYRADAQIDYDTEHDWQWPQNKSSRWVMPNWYYKRRIFFGNTTLDVFTIATNWVHIAESCGEIRYAQKRCDPHACRASLRSMSDTSWRFLEAELPASDADWKFVVGHRPLDSLSRWMSPTRNFVDLLRRNGVSMYIAGHRHTLEEHWVTPSKQVPFFEDGPARAGAVLEVVSGAGGGSYSDGEVAGMSRWGFNGVKVTKNSLRVDYISDSGKLLRSVHVGPPCEQLRGRRCEWAVGAWSPSAPCCGGSLGEAGCTTGLRTREVRCAAGSEASCAGSARPNATETCEAPPPPSTTTTLRSSTSAASLLPIRVGFEASSPTLPTVSPEDEAEAEELGDVGEPNGMIVLSHWAFTAIMIAAAAVIIACVLSWAHRRRERRSSMQASAGEVGGYRGATPRGDRFAAGAAAAVVAPAGGPTLLPRPPGARQLPSGPQPDTKSPRKPADAIELELEAPTDPSVEPPHRCGAVTGLIIGNSSALPPPRSSYALPGPLCSPRPSPRFPGLFGSPQPSPRMPEEPAVVPQAPHVRTVQTTSMYFEASAKRASAGTADAAAAAALEEQERPKPQGGRGGRAVRKPAQSALI